MLTDNDKALDKIIRASMPLDFERKETLSDDKALVERLRWSDGWFFENPWDHVVYASDDPLEAADRIEAKAAEIERLESLIGVTANHWLALQDKHPILWEGAIDAAMAAACAEIERLREALAKSEALQDLAYYNGAKQYAAISAQSEDAARDWLNGGCGNRQRDAIAALGETK